jgi:hypothetical protein
MSYIRDYADALNAMKRIEEMGRINSYNLVRVDNGLSAVNLFLNNGFRLYGNIVKITGAFAGEGWFQAVIKKE